MTSTDIEVAVARYLNPRTNLIVPNISWGLDLHECDLLVVTKSGCAWEIEIKVSKYDLIKDKSKPHKHDSHKIKYLYFAIPESLLEHKEHIPERAGIIVVYKKDLTTRCETVRQPQSHSNYKFTDSERYAVARLGSMRIWDLKYGQMNLRADLERCRKELKPKEVLA